MNQLSLFDSQRKSDLSTIEDTQELLNFISNSGCTACPRGDFRNKHSDLKMAIYRGNPNAKIWVVGKSPGVDDAKEGSPFAFGSGDKLRDLISYCKLDGEKEVFWINPVFCPAQDNDTPSPRELAACSVYFNRLVELCKPKVFLAVGATAYEALVGKPAKISEIAGKDYAFETQYNAPAWVIYHTAYWFKTGAPIEEIRRKTEITLNAFKKQFNKIGALSATDIANKMGVTRGRVTQLNASVARKLRWPNQIKELKKIIDE